MGFHVFSAKHLIKICSIAVIALVTFIFAIQGTVKVIQTAGVPRKLPIYCVDAKEKLVAFSFDAAWGNEDTQLLIDIFKKYNIKVTFFVVGSWVDKYPESVKALHEAGHDIENHSDTHPHVPRLSREQMAKEISNCSDKIESITGVRPTLFRAPYGEYNNALIEVLGEQGTYCIQWDVDSLDWKDISADKITQKVTSKVKNGSIVLFHNAALNTPEALPQTIEKLQAEGYKFVKISDLIMKDHYMIDHQGMQIKIETTSGPSVSTTVQNTTR